MLEIKNLKASIENKKILKGINLNILPGELHAIMGPNGSGKSTLAHVLAGREIFEVLDGKVIYNGNDLLDLDPEERALNGVFMSYQYPAVIPGVNLAYFLKAAVNAVRKHRGQKEMDSVEFLNFIKEKMSQVQMDEKYLKRSVNDGFSGGEKKRNEILQMLSLDPSLAILDETDSGLDIDAIRIVANGVNEFRRSDRSVIVITHYQRILQYMNPDKIHVLMDGKIIKSGGKELALELEEKGYSWLEKSV
tara:strand:+ start:197 stop:943 length:747 start_codon:yes stop_codon:yes gene_type:complete